MTLLSRKKGRAQVQKMIFGSAIQKASTFCRHMEVGGEGGEG